MNRFEIRVGLLEDMPFTRAFVRRTLLAMHHFGLSVEARTPQELLDGLERAADLPQILLLDIGLPEMNGYEITKILRRRYPSIRVLALSVHREAFAVVQMIRLGALGFMDKAHMEELEYALSAIRDGRVFFSKSIPQDWVKAAMAEVRPVSLTAKEYQTLRFCAGGFTFSQIADTMGVCEKTAHEYKAKLFRKLDVHNTGSMVRVAMGAGLLRIGEEIPSWEEEVMRKKKMEQKAKRGE